MTMSIGLTLFLGNIGGKVGAIDGAIGASTSYASNDQIGTVTGTIQSITSAVGMIPGPLGGLGNAIAVGITIGKVGGTDKISWGDVLGVIGGVAGIVAATAAAPGVIALGTIVSLGAGVASLTYTLANLPSNTQTVSASVGTTPDPLVKTIRYVDPLILDLDGDGLEITPLSHGILFDADGDTIKTGTAWANADDGILVWDRNGNGIIDSGKELFGDETVLASGQKAANGFAALAELDTGSVVDGVTVGAGDGIFDANDAQYANLRIWRDLNQDGISQAEELQTLAEAGMTSIKLISDRANTNYGDAILAQSGTFTRADGSSGQAGRQLHPGPEQLRPQVHPHHGQRCRQRAA
ncbi:hypothetical protein [Ralstonia solanacearum]|uniref:hypothetical protein n=1 Tax=Ralstonia solanacearum TaxID=305 RepID=UPI00234935FA|nr:hypothetical protein [Ralstonia solanacearum]MDC6213320.1 hypothetical protein [Ralstonia solanacearum]